MFADTNARYDDYKEYSPSPVRYSESPFHRFPSCRGCYSRTHVRRLGPRVLDWDLDTAIDEYMNLSSVHPKERDPYYYRISRLMSGLDPGYKKDRQLTSEWLDDTRFKNAYREKYRPNFAKVDDKSWSSKWSDNILLPSTEDTRDAMEDRIKFKATSTDLNRKINVDEITAKLLPPRFSDRIIWEDLTNERKEKRPTDYYKKGYFREPNRIVRPKGVNDSQLHKLVV